MKGLWIISKARQVGEKIKTSKEIAPLLGVCDASLLIREVFFLIEHIPSGGDQMSIRYIFSSSIYQHLQYALRRIDNYWFVWISHDQNDMIKWRIMFDHQFNVTRIVKV